MFTYGLLFTIGSLVFTIILAMIYSSKKRLSLVRNKLYFSLLITIIVFQISEIISIIVLKYINVDILTAITWRFHWIVGIFVFGLLYMYCVTFIKNFKLYYIRDLFNQEKKFKIVGIILFIMMIIYILLPYDKLDINNLTFIPGIAPYVLGTTFIFILLLITIELLKNRKNTSFDIRLAVWILIIITITVIILQLIFPHISFIPISFSLEALFVYFAVENPDLETIAELQKLQEDVEKSGKAKLDFLFNMSHDIRSPMNAIVSLSNLLNKMNTFDENQIREDIENIKVSGNNLVDIINNILDISKIETGEEELQLKNYSLNNITKDLLGIINSRIGDKHIQFIMNIDQNISSVLYGDSTKIYQILMNLLTNAAKYTEVGRITLNINSTKNGDMETLHIKVTDTGYGIKEEDFNKLFTKFNRLEDATQNEIEGTGLGLTITKKYVDLMRGRIWFESEYEVGTTFFVDIPQKIVDDTPLSNLITDVENINKNIELIDCSKYKILIVDDNKLNVKVATRLLSKYKFQIDTLYSGKECVYKIKEGNQYDMIFLDHMMPDMDGIRVLHIIKKLDGYTIPPVVALTANAMNGMREMYLNEGFSEYLSKPIDINKLNKIINKYFNKKQ